MVPDVYTSAAGILAEHCTVIRSGTHVEASVISASRLHDTTPGGKSACCNDVVITATGDASFTMCVISRSRYSTFTGTTMMPVLMHASQRSMISMRLVR